MKKTKNIKKELAKKINQLKKDLEEAIWKNDWDTITSIESQLLLTQQKLKELTKELPEEKKAWETLKKDTSKLLALSNNL